MSDGMLPDDEDPLEFLVRDWMKSQEPCATTEPDASGAGIAFYLRKSSDDPQDLSIGAQLQLCISQARSAAGSPDRRPLLFIDRNRSGLTMIGREGLAEMLEAARSGRFQKLFVRAVDRLTRSVGDALRIYDLLTEYGVSIHVAGKGQVHLLELIILALSAQRERERLSLALGNGKRCAATAGAFFGSWPTYGYDQIDGDWRINREQADLIERCFLELDGRLNAEGLCKLLNKEGVPPPIGRLWRTAILFKHGTGLLDRPLLKGLFVWGLEHEDPVVVRRRDLRIVDADLFDRVNNRYGRRSGPRKPRTTPRFLQGLVSCACGRRMTVNEGDPHLNVYCTEARLGSPCGRTESLHFGELARRVLHLFRHEILDPDCGPDLEERRRLGWRALDAEMSAERHRISARIEQIGSRMEALSPDGAEEIHPLIAAECCELELEHHQLSERLSELVSPTFPAVDWERAEARRAQVLRVMERLPESPAKLPEGLEVIELVRSMVVGIELDIGPDGYLLRVHFGTPGCPSAFDRFARVADQSWEQRFPRPLEGPLRFPEVVLGHHRRADAGAFLLDDGDWAAIELLFPSAPDAAFGRLLAEALLFVKSTGLAPRYLPGRYSAVAGVFRHGSFGAVWLRMYEILRRRRSPAIAGIGPAAPKDGKVRRFTPCAYPVPRLAGPVGQLEMPS